MVPFTTILAGLSAILFLSAVTSFRSVARPTPAAAAAFRTRLSADRDAFRDLLQEQGGWYAMGDAYVLLPTDQAVPKSIVHFCGGFLAGMSGVTVAYNGVLQTLADAGHLIVATPIPTFSMDHGALARTLGQQFATCYGNPVRKLVGKGFDDVPVIGLSHSLGGKLTVLVNSRKEDRRMQPVRAGNVYMCFNNFGMQATSNLTANQAVKFVPELEGLFSAATSPEVRRVVDAVQGGTFLSSAVTNALGGLGKGRGMGGRGPMGAAAGGMGGLGEGLSEALGALGEQLGADIGKRVDAFSRDVKQQVDAAVGSFPTDAEFDPSPDETWALLQAGYNVQRNVLLQLSNDDIDQSDALAANLRRRGCDVALRRTDGTHITPLTPTSLQRARRDADASTSAGAGEAAVAARFLRELVMTMDQLADAGWEEKDRKRRDRFVLPPAK